ncbi:PucR family transcriptional regulator [Glutamicibacter endophyticus]
MTYGRNFTNFHTDCPEQSPLTISELLTFPAVLAGNPQVFAQESRLERRIQWAHVLETVDASSHLRGHELVLTTGIAWGTGINFRMFVAELLERHCPGLVLELGNAVPQVPADLLTACHELGLPLIAMHEPVAFVEITEAVHQHLFSWQTRRLEAGGEVTDHFTELMQVGTPADSVLDHCARMLGSTVVLEDSGYNVVHYCSPGDLPKGFFEDWQDHSAAQHRRGNPERYAVPVVVRGKQFGTLLCPAEAEHPAGVNHVLTMAASALGTDLLYRPGPLLWKLGTANRLLDRLLNHREPDMERLHTEFESVGFATRGRYLRGFAVQVATTADPQEALTELNDLWRAGGMVLGGSAPGAPQVLFGLYSSEERAHPQTLGDRCDPPLYVGSVATDLPKATVSLAQALAGHELELPGTGKVRQAADDPLALLVHELRHEPAIQRLPQQHLEPLLTLNPTRRDDYIRVLESYLTHPTNRSKAAEHSHLSRSVFYQRLGDLEKLLQLDLGSSATLTILSLALHVYRHSRSTRPRQPVT